MSVLRIRWEDVAGLKRLENAMAMLSSDKLQHALRRAVNHTGDKAKTQVIRALAKQTGLRQKTIRKAIKVRRANYDSLEYVLTTRGGDIALKYFSARETRHGVKAKPFGEWQTFADTFMKGGRFPKRVEAKGLNGHVYKRVGPKRLPIEIQDSGVIIPAEMLKGATAEAFTKVVNNSLPSRVMHEMSRLAPGVFE